LDNTVLTETATVMEKGLADLHIVAPLAEKVLSLFPGFGSYASMIVQIVDGFVPDIINALTVLMKSNGNDIVQARIQLSQHINPDMTNIPALSGTK
jgi:hypothetical protein